MALKQENSLTLYEIYTRSSPTSSGRFRQGPTIAFNFIVSEGDGIVKSDVEQIAFLSGIQFRTGGACDPGGITASLNPNATAMRQNLDEGLGCGNDVDGVNSKPTGTFRVSVGAMSSVQDVERFTNFLAPVHRGMGRPCEGAAGLCIAISD